MGGTPYSPLPAIFNYIRERAGPGLSYCRMPIPRPKEVLRKEIKGLLTRLNDEFDRIRKKRRDNSKILETITDEWICLRTQVFGFESVHVKRATLDCHLAIRVAEDSLREFEELLKTLSNKF